MHLLTYLDFRLAIITNPLDLRLPSKIKSLYPSLKTVNRHLSDNVVKSGRVVSEICQQTVRHMIKSESGDKQDSTVCVRTKVRSVECNGVSELETIWTAMVVSVRLTINTRAAASSR